MLLKLMCPLCFEGFGNLWYPLVYTNNDAEEGGSLKKCNLSFRLMWVIVGHLCGVGDTLFWGFVG